MMKNDESNKVFLPPPFEAYEGDEPYIFVSYSHQDKNSVYPEIVRIHNLGYHIWYDEGIELESKIPDQIAKKIKNSTVLIFFVSPNSIKSDFVLSEINYALDKSIKLIPIVLKQTNFPEGLEMRLSSTTRIDKFNMIEELYNRKIDSFLKRELGSNEIIEKTKDLRLKNTGANSFMLGKLQISSMYQVFIVFRDIDENGDSTYDSVLARKIFRFLSNKGLNIFLNSTSIGKAGKKESEKDVKIALESSQIMVVVGMSPENINFKKVRHEWSCFDKFIRDDSKPNVLLVSYIKDFDGLELPETLQKNEIITDDENSLERLYLLIKTTLGIEGKNQNKDFKLEILFQKSKGIFLIRIKGDGPDKILLPPNELVTGIKVGRSNDNDIVLNRGEVSRYHALINYSQEELWVEDKNSKNGTFVNNEKITKAEIKPGDVVRFDAVSYKVCLPEKLGV